MFVWTKPRVALLVVAIAAVGMISCSGGGSVGPKGFTPPCEEANCTPVTGAYISHFRDLGCTGPEAYYTAYNNYDGVKRSWDGQGVAGTQLRTLTHKSYKMGDTCYDAWPSGNTLSDFVRIYRPSTPAPTPAVECGEASCTPITEAYISHFRDPGCTGPEAYYTAYNGYDGVKRSWDGKGLAGTQLRTLTHKSYKMGITCYDEWPSGNTLSDFVYVYR